MRKAIFGILAIIIAFIYSARLLNKCSEEKEASKTQSYSYPDKDLEESLPSIESSTYTPGKVPSKSTNTNQMPTIDYNAERDRMISKMDEERRQRERKYKEDSAKRMEAFLESIKEDLQQKKDSIQKAKKREMLLANDDTIAQTSKHME